ncbi:MAG: hypothetical protein K5945_06885 [Bacteroidaceae bacterium]|nr:hypothetical protein [Bacteroidaceae bacterium]
MRSLLRILCGTLLLAALPAVSPQAQGTRSLSLELLGVHNAVGINYDARFRPSSALGYRVGLGYAYSEDYNFLHNTTRLQGVAVPLEVNYLLGKRCSRLELGFGASLGCYFEDYELTHWTYDPANGGVYNAWSEPAHDCGFGYFLFGDIGYRYQKPGGFIFRAGITPSFHFGDRHGIDRILLAPHLSFGWSF